MPVSSWLRKLQTRFATGTHRRPRKETQRFRPRRLPLWLERLEDRTVPVIFTVTSNAAAGPGTLHAAITSANATPGEDLITFNLPAGLNVIHPSPLTPFPTIVESLIIDGKTQNGYVPSTDTTPAIQIVTLDGDAGGPLDSGLVNGLTANAVGRLIVDGLLIQKFQADGVRITNSGQLVMTDDRFLSNRSDGIEANTITNGATGVLLRGIVSQNQVSGAGINLTTIARYTDTNSTYSNNAENGIRLEDINGDLRLTNVTATDNNFDEVFGTGSGLVAFDGFDSDLHAINGAVLFEGCNFGTSPFMAEGSQRQFDGVRILGVQGTITFANYMNSLGVLQVTQANFNDSDGVHIEAAADITSCVITVDRGSFNNNGGDGLDISLFGISNVNVGNVDLFRISANSNGESGLEALAIPGTLSIHSGNALELAEFNLNGQTFTGGDGLTLRNVNIINLFGGVTGTGVVADRNADAGMEITTANSLTDVDGKYTNNNNSGIRVVDIAGNVSLTRPTLQNNDFNTNGAGSGFEGLDGADNDTVAILGSLTILGGKMNALLGSPSERQFRGLTVDGVGGAVVLGPSTGLVQQTIASNNSDDGINIANALSVDITGGTYSFNGQVMGLGDGTGDGIDLNLISGAVNLTFVVVNDNGNSGLEASNIGGAITVSNFGGNSTFDNNGKYLGPMDPQGGDGINLFSVNALSLNPTNTPIGVSASNNKAAVGGAFNGRGGRGIAITNALGTLTDNIGNYTNNANGGIILIDMNDSVVLTRTTANTNDFDNLPDEFGLGGDGFRATDQDGDGFGIRNNLTINGGRFSDVQPGAPTQQTGIFVDGIGGNVLFQNAGAQTMQANTNQQDGVFLANGVNATFTNGSYSGNGFGTTDDGIDISSFTGTVTLTNLTANDNASDGAQLINLFAVSISGGTYQSNDDNGIDAFSLTSFAIANSNTSGNVEDNILVDTVAGNVDVTSVTSNQSVNGTGLVVIDVGGTVTITGGTFNQNGADGISLDPIGSLVVTNVTSNLNVGSGLDGDDIGTVSVTDSTFNQNGLVGVFIQNVTGNATYDGVTANQNGLAGLSGFNYDGTTTVTNGTFDLNGLGGVELGDMRDVLFNTVTATRNGLAGGFVTTALSFTDVNSVYSQNDLNGLVLVDISGNVSLDTIRADDNDFDSDGFGDGVAMDTVGGDVDITNSLFRDTVAVGLQQTGLLIDGVGGTVAMNFSSAEDNVVDGIGIIDALSVEFDFVSATGNGDDGLDLNFVGSFTDNDGNYSSNDDDGMALADLGNVVLTRTVAQDNDFDDNGVGSGVFAFDGLDGNMLAIDNNFTATGVDFSNKTIGGPQQFGLVIVDGVGNDVTIQADTLFGIAPVMSGNEQNGAAIVNVGRDLLLTDGFYDDNGEDGISALGVDRNVFMDFVEALNNGLQGADLDTVDGSVTISNSNISNNFDGGILLTDVTNNVRLENVTANDNDANGDIVGDGANFLDGGDGDANAIGGNLTIINSNFNNTGVGQSFGVFVESLAGALGLTNTNATGNDVDGFTVGDGGTTGTFTGGNYSDNGGNGIFLNAVGSFSGNVLLSGVTASDNDFDGVLAVSLNGTTTVTGGTFDGNGGDGLDLIGNGAGRSLVLNGSGSASDNGDDGLFATGFGSGVTISGSWTFNNNGGDGIEVTNSGAVVFTGVTATGNDPGANIIGVASFSDTAGNYSANDNDGIRLIDIAGNVTLVRTTADDNDADNDIVGNGVSAIDGGDGDGFAIGGNLLVQGARFRDSGGLTHQEFGFFAAGVAANAVQGNVTFQDSAGPVQSMIVTGNEQDGVNIDGAAAGAFTNGNYSSNGNDGIDLNNFASATFTNLTASGNSTATATGDGLEVTNTGIVNINGVTASNNSGGSSQGFDVANATTLSISDFTGLGNGSGNGGAINNVTTVNFTTTTTPPNVMDDVTLAPGFFQHTRAGLALQPITYIGINTLNMFFLDGDDQLIFVGGDYSPFFTGVNPTLNVDGGNHIIGDALTFNATNGPDLIEATGLTLTINGVPVSNPPGINTIMLTNFEILGVNGLQGDDTFDIDGFPAIAGFNALRFNGNEDDDIIDASAAPLNPAFTPFLNGNDGDDTIVGGVNNEFIDGGNDDDLLIGNGGDDNIIAGAGNDFIDGGAGNDTTSGGAGDDTFSYAGTVALGSDIVDDLPNCVENDWLDFSGFAPAANMLGVTIDIGAAVLQMVNPALSLTLSNGTAIENVQGSNRNDNVTGNICDNTLIGLDGDDVLTGLDGADTIDGGNDNDLLTGGIGDDSLAGGAGDDTMTGGVGDDTTAGGADNDRYIYSGTNLGSDLVIEAASVDTDTLDFTSFGGPVSINLGLTTLQNVNGLNLNLTLSSNTGLENVEGSANSDSVTGNTRDNLLNGNNGADSISGLAGDDSINGGDGNDTILGGPATVADVIHGDNQNDLIIWNMGDGSQIIDGDAGTDTVTVNGNANPEEFTIAPDVIDPNRTDLNRVSPSFSLDIGTTEVFDLNTGGGNDTVTTSSDFTEGGILTTLDIDASTGDDLFRADFTSSNVLPPTTIFTGGIGNDTILLEGAGTPFTTETYNSFSFNSGNIDLDGQDINYNTTEQLQQTKAATNLVFNATNGVDEISVTNGDDTINGFNTTRIASLNGTFVPLDFANKTNAEVFGLLGGDDFTINNSTPADGLAQMTFTGGTNADPQLDGDAAADSFLVTPSATVPYTVNGGNPVNVCPGDTLDFNPPNLPGQQLTLTGPSQGFFTFTGLQTVSFTSIEDLPGLQIIVTGTDFGKTPKVRVYDAVSGLELLPGGFKPFSDFKGGVRVAAGDINGDCIPDIITAAGPGSSGLVRVFDGFQLRFNGVVQQIGKVKPFGSDFTKGLFVATGDLDGDGMGDVVVGTGGPSKTKVAIVSGADLINLSKPPKKKFQAFPDSFKGGVTVAVGDYNGDLQLDIIAGSGPTGEPRVRVFDGQNTNDVIDDFLAFDPAFRRGIYVGAADVDGDGMAEIIVTRNASGLSEVQPFDLQISPAINVKPEARTFDFSGDSDGDAKVATATKEVFPNDYTSGVRVGGWSDGGVGQFLATNGPGVAPSQVKKLDAALAETLFIEYANDSTGFFVAGSQRRFGLPVM